MIEGSLYTFLSTIGEVTDIVGDRIFPQHADEPVYPCLIYSLVTQSHDHIVTGSAGTARARVQFDCWSYSLADCSIAIEAIRQHLQGFQGLLGTIEVVGSHLNNELDLSEKPTDGSNRWLYRKTGITRFGIECQSPRLPNTSRLLLLVVSPLMVLLLPSSPKFNCASHRYLHTLGGNSWQKLLVKAQFSKSMFLTH
ncbi:MAG: DUF3168 domain-containing protein [Planctomycetaceae bacterium]